MRKIVFITASDIFDPYGNGGSKGSKKNYDILVDKFGKSNVTVILLCLPTYAIDSDIKDNIICIKQPNGNIPSLFTCNFGCKKFFPGERKRIWSYIESLNPKFVFYDGTTIGKLIKKHASYLQIVFFHNIEVDYALNKVKNESFLYLPSYWASKINEKRVIWADKIGCLNIRDGKIIEKRYGKKPDFYFPVTFTDSFDENRAKVNCNNRLLFMGSCFGPNIDGVKWFIDNVMPELPNIHLDIVGKGFEEKRKEYERGNNNVHVIGSVKETSRYYYGHDIVVMPIFYGAGMKVKTAEAMMYGKIIIATDEALEGYDVTDIDGIYRCNTQEEFVKAILLATDKHVGAWNRPVRERFLEKYETKTLRRTVDEVFDG